MQKIKLIEQVAMIIFSNSQLRANGLQAVWTDKGGEPPFRVQNVDSLIGFDPAKVRKKTQEPSHKSKP